MIDWAHEIIEFSVSIIIGLLIGLRISIKLMDDADKMIRGDKK